MMSIPSDKQSADPILVLDIGSSSVRALLYEVTAEPVFGASVSHEHAHDHPEPGASTADARTLRGLVETCIDDLLTHPRAGRVAAVACAAFADTLVGLDERGSPLTPVYTYADSRAVAAVAPLHELFGAEWLHQHTGCMLHPAHRLAKLVWLRQSDPTLFESVVEWVDFPTYLYRAWFGGARTSLSLASWSGLIDRASRAWSSALIEAVGITAAMLPAVGDYREAFVGLSGPYRMRWGALQDTPFLLPIGDGAAANVGVGAVDGACVALTVGTTGAVRTLVKADVPPTLPPGIFGYRIDAMHHLIGGATTEGGVIYTWAQETLRLASNIEEVLLLRAPDSHGLTVLPLLGGERSPGYAAHATGAIVGLRLDTTPIDIAQALMESVALRLSLVLAQLAPHPAATIAAGGGVIRASRAWTQMIADALDRPLHVIDSDEVTARGAAILALSALQAIPVDATREAFPPLVRTIVEPNPEAARAFVMARDRQAALYAAVISG
ncbi:MAG: FGGY family carbohydrate kinase [Chloroflexota bacterium]|nr:FGGY family carbohydrate kinase [Chloroflexota bacterium]